MKKILFLFIDIVFLFSSCLSNKPEQIEEQVNNVYHNKIYIPFDSLICIHSRITVDDNLKYTHSRFKILNFVDSKSCSECTILKMTYWNEYLYSNEEISSAFIFEANSSIIHQIEESYNECGLDHPIYIDTCGAFRKCNPFIPDNSIFHTLLLNESDSIILIGNPLNNEKIAKLYKRVLFEKEQVSEKQ
ncbi:MAG: hypothetical protein IJS20_01060 [Bacteroidales bacterium]|nr:hypothetical protein [Bacteroidales bacterium]